MTQGSYHSVKRPCAEGERNAAVVRHVAGWKPIIDIYLKIVYINCRITMGGYPKGSVPR